MPTTARKFDQQAFSRAVEAGLGAQGPGKGAAVAIGEAQLGLAEKRWSAQLTRAQEHLVEASRIASEIADPAIHEGLARRTRSHAPSAMPATWSAGPGVNLCQVDVERAPFPIGYPSSLETGKDALVLGGKPGAKVKTFVQLATPGEGALSLGATLGKVVYSPSRSIIYPAESETQGYFGPVEFTSAQGGLGAIAQVPSAPLDDTTELRIVADVVVGPSPYPFYHLLAQPSSGAGITAFVGTHLLVVGSEGDRRDVSETLLEEHLLSTGFSWTRVPQRQYVRYDFTLTLQPGTVWVYVGLAARVEVQRWWIAVQEPALEKRTGFVGVDLLAPTEGLPSELPLQPAGPIRLQSVQLTFCPYLLSTQ